MALALFGSAGAQLGRQQGLLDPNIASEKDLLALPSLNAAMVKGMMERRPFLSMADLNAFLSQSLKKEQLAELYAKLFLHLNLNTATEEEIMMIPGVGKRIAHEFEEYRPYKNIEQFRREMSKYWNAKEVARLERYVALE
jgi:DNA uptake protein ComE-like DNA-binding protein